MEILSNYYNHLAIFGHNYKCGLITFEGTIVLDAEYIGIQYKEEFDGYLLTTYEGLVGIANKWGRVIIAATFKDIQFSSGFFLCNSDNRHNQLYSLSGEYLVDYETIEIELLHVFPLYKIEYVDNNFEQRNALISLDGKFVLDTNNSHTEIEDIYDNPYPLIVINSNGERNIYNSALQLVFHKTQKFEVLDEYSLFKLNIDNKCGVIDFQNNIVVDYIYEDINILKDHLAIVRKDEQYGIISLYGDTLVDTQYKNIEITRKGFIARTFTNILHLYDKDFKIIATYDDSEENISTMYSICDGYYLIESIAYEQGVVNRKGEFIVPLNYDTVEMLGNYFKVIIDGEPSFSFCDDYPIDANKKEGIFDKKGKEVIPCCYYSINLLKENFRCKIGWDDDEYVFFNISNGSVNTSGWALDFEHLDIDQRITAFTNGSYGQCPYCGNKGCHTYTDGTARCPKCHRLFRYW